MKKGLAVRNQKEREGWQFGIEKRRLRNWKWRRETREEVQRGLVFLFFIFCLRDCRESYNRRGRFSFLLKPGESTERVRLALRACFHLGRERLGCRGPPWSLLSPIYMYMYLYLLGFHEWWKMRLVDDLLPLFLFHIVWLMLTFIRCVVYARVYGTFSHLLCMLRS